MTAPESRLGCRVLDKDGDDWNALAFSDTGYAEWRAVERARRLANHLIDLTPFTIVDADGVTLHTIHAARPLTETTDD